MSGSQKASLICSKAFLHECPYTDWRISLIWSSRNCPRCTLRWDDPRKTLLCCHFFRLARTNDVFAQVRLQFLFTSRAFIYMVRISWERQPMLLFSDIYTELTQSPFEDSMGLPEAHSILLHFSNNGRAYQAVLVSMSSAPSKSKKGEHAMWKHVLPVSTDFAWLPEDVADAFCSFALHQDPTRPYGSFHEVQLGFNEHYQALLHIEGLYYLGETRSVDEFNIFSQMPAERLCLGCGVQSDERLMPPQDRGKLFAATLRLMQLVLTDRPRMLLMMKSRLGRLSTHGSTIEMAISLLPSQRYFYLCLRARQIAQLVEYSEQAKPEQQQQLSQGWSLSILPWRLWSLRRKINVASQAFAEQIIGLSLPSWIETKIGRLVGFMALHNQTTGTTKLDIPSAHTPWSYWLKAGHHWMWWRVPHECASKYCPVAQWMSEVDLTLHWESAVREPGWNGCHCPSTTQLPCHVAGRPQANSWRSP